MEVLSLFITALINENYDSNEESNIEWWQKAFVTVGDFNYGYHKDFDCYEYDEYSVECIPSGYEEKMREG